MIRIQVRSDEKMGVNTGPNIMSSENIDTKFSSRQASTSSVIWLVTY